MVRSKHWAWQSRLRVTMAGGECTALGKRSNQELRAWEREQQRLLPWRCWNHPAYLCCLHKVNVALYLSKRILRSQSRYKQIRWAQHVVNPWVQFLALYNLAYWYMPIIRVLGKWRQDDEKFKVVFGCILSSGKSGLRKNPSQNKNKYKYIQTKSKTQKQQCNAYLKTSSWHQS